MNYNMIISARLLSAVLLFLCPAIGHAALCFCFHSTSPKSNFTFKMELPDENWKHGTVQYKGQKEKIAIVLTGSEELERYEGRPSYMKYTWNEVYKGKITGTYVLCIQGARIYDSWYTRKRDHLKMSIEQSLLGDECDTCL